MSRLAALPVVGLVALVAGAGCVPALRAIPALPTLPSLPAPPAPAASVRLPAPGPVPPPGERGRGCFGHHLREANDLNQRREDAYAAMTAGASRPISRKLIASERVALAAAWHVDRRARRYQDAGIPVACAEFVSMALTPAPVPDRPLSHPGRPYRSGPDPDSLGAALVAAYGSGGFPGVAATSARLLHDLEDRPAYHCMTRHLLESIWRVAWLAPEHARGARRAGLPSPVPLSELLLRLHLAALPEGAALDNRAAPLQEAGVPILCRDVPRLR